jgi:hypothetical protein
MSILFFWIAMLHQLVGRHQRFRENVFIFMTEVGVLGREFFLGSEGLG